MMGVGLMGMGLDGMGVVMRWMDRAGRMRGLLARELGGATTPVAQILAPSSSHGRTLGSAHHHHDNPEILTLKP